jgi:hypothetical protein
MKMFMVILLWCFMFVFSSFGRLNESVDECDKRYGKPVDVVFAQDGFIYRYYFKSGYMIGVVFKDKNAIRISYRKLNASNQFYQNCLQEQNWKNIALYSRFMSLKLSPLIIERLLQINSGGMKWQNIIPGEIWSREDGVQGVYDKMDRDFAINSKTYLEFIQQSAGKDLVGF